jgi:hypothetical protein
MRLSEHGDHDPSEQEQSKDQDFGMIAEQIVPSW